MWELGGACGAQPGPPHMSPPVTPEHPGGCRKHSRKAEKVHTQGLAEVAVPMDATLGDRTHPGPEGASEPCSSNFRVPRSSWGCGAHLCCLLPAQDKALRIQT